MSTLNKSLDDVLNEKMKGKNLPIVPMAALLFIGLLIGFSHNSSPAPFIAAMIPYFNLDPVNNQSMINLSMSIMFASTIPATFIGTYLEQKIGTRKLFSLVFLFTAIGVLMVFLSGMGYWMLLASRVVYGFGFGLSFAALGSAMMLWFRQKGRRVMTTINGLFPLFGALISYTVYPAVGQVAGGEEGLSAGWQMGLGCSGFVAAAVLILWLVIVRKSVDSINIAGIEEQYHAGTQTEKTEPAENKSENAVVWVLKTNQMRCLTVAFICDFMMYMYIATVLPMWLINAGNMSETTANTWTAISFPVFGVAGTILGGIITNAIGKRRPVILTCQILKLLGICIACFGSNMSTNFILFGIAVFGLGNGGWMPALYITPTEIPDVNASRVAAGYSTFNAFGFVAGLIMPVIGGLITTQLILHSSIVGEAAQLAYGYKWSMLILGLFHIFAIIAAIKLKETGPGRKQKQEVENPVEQEPPSQFPHSA